MKLENSYPVKGDQSSRGVLALTVWRSLLNSTKVTKLTRRKIGSKLNQASNIPRRSPVGNQH